VPVHPKCYSDKFGRLLRRPGLRRITLHDSRHTTLTLTEHAGVDQRGERAVTVPEFAAFRRSLQKMAALLGVSDVAMESTGVYWRRPAAQPVRAMRRLGTASDGWLWAA
jgi:integrase